MPVSNNFVASDIMQTVYDAEGKPIEVSRPNAKDLVGSGKYFWNKDDIGKSAEAAESDLADVVTLFSADGKEVQVNRANARDLLNNGYSRKNPAAAESEVEDTTVEEPVDPEPEPEVASEALTKPKVEDPLDPINSTLAEIAQRVTGNEDVAAYLETFSEDNLRQMSEERYGEKPHHRSSKEKMIAKMIELEDAKLSAE